MQKVALYVYGSCHYNDKIDRNSPIGNGGYGVVIEIDGLTKELSGGFSKTTHARMDLIGIIEGIKNVSEPRSLLIYLSSAYIINSICNGWLTNWKEKGYQKIKHSDLWRELDKLLLETRHSITFSHAGKLKDSSIYRRAEFLAKSMSSKPHLDPDLNFKPDDLELFTGTNNDIEDPREFSKPILESICVDASCIDNPGPTEYKAVDTKTREVIFEYKLEEGTNNIGEFLAIVHALAYYKQKNLKLDVLYSDSMTAIAWVRQKKCKTKFLKTEKNIKTFELLERAEIWLKNNSYDTLILKWDTDQWGEIPADYGRK